MDTRLLEIHTASQRESADTACRALRRLDPKVLSAVLKHWRDSDLPGSAARINASVEDYRKRLSACSLR